jgi:hypothetical protein
MTYPGAGVANSTGSAWGTSYAVGTSASNLVQLDSSAKLPAVNGENLLNVKIPRFYYNIQFPQYTTAGAIAQPTNWMLGGTIFTMALGTASVGYPSLGMKLTFATNAAYSFYNALYQSDWFNTANSDPWRMEFEYSMDTSITTGSDRFECGFIKDSTPSVAVITRWDTGASPADTGISLCLNSVNLECFHNIVPITTGRIRAVWEKLSASQVRARVDVSIANSGDYTPGTWYNWFTSGSSSSNDATNHYGVTTFPTSSDVMKPGCIGYSYSATSMFATVYRNSMQVGNGSF